MESIRMVGLLALLALLTACAQNVKRYNSSSVAFLYPDNEHVIETPDIPNLRLPLKVGVAFVPENDNTPGVHTGHPAAGLITGSQDQVIPESEKASLLEKVSQRFEDLAFVQSIEIIPSAYLRPRGGFTNLDQLKILFGIDVIALIAYDQTQFTDEGMASVTYWTLVGAYIVPGEKNATHTMMDAAVYDIDSRSMLFRAPGVSQVKSTATPINLSEQLRQDRVVAFDMAADNLLTNLERQLARFKASIKKHPESVNIVHRAGYSGGGSLGAFWAILCGVIGIVGIRLHLWSD